MTPEGESLARQAEQLMRVPQEELDQIGVKRVTRRETALLFLVASRRFGERDFTADELWEATKQVIDNHGLQAWLDLEVSVL